MNACSSGQPSSASDSRTPRCMVLCFRMVSTDILSLSDLPRSYLVVQGNSEGLGKERELELKQSYAALGVDSDKVSVLDHP